MGNSVDGGGRPVPAWVMATRYWPLFDLRLETPRLVLRPVTDTDLDGFIEVIEAGIHSPDEQPFGRAWTDGTPAQVAQRFAQFHWQIRSTWSTERWILAFAIEWDGRVVGCQDLRGHHFAALREVNTGSWLTASAQGQGLGKEMRAAVLTLAFENLGAEIARTEAMVSNRASLGVTRALGYRENGRERLAPRGTPVDAIRFEMTRAEWEASALPRATVRNFDQCAHMFGLST